MAKARRKPGLRWQSRDTGGGLPPKSSRESSRASETVHETFGSTCRWKAFWIDEAVPFDEGAGEAVLGASRRVRSKRPGRARGATESVRGRSPTSHAADNAAVRWPPPSSGSPPHPPTAQSGGARREKWSNGPKLGTAPSSALHLGLGRPSPLGERKRAGAAVVQELGLERAWARGWRRSARRKPPRSGIRRSTGARVVSRLQKSARSIFHARPRGAERRTEVTRGSTPRRFRP
jgi:hypothetical protein